MRLFLIIFSVFVFILNATSKTLTIDNNISNYSLKEYCYGFTDSSNILTIDDVITKDWKNLGERGPVYGIAKFPQWIKLELKNPYNHVLRRYLYIPYHHIEYIDVYTINNSSLITHKETGTARPFSNKDLEARGYPMHISMPGNSVTEVYIRVQHTNLPLRVSLFLMDTKKVQSVVSSIDSISWYWEGVMTITLLFSLVLFFFVRSKLFLYYFLLNIGVYFFVSAETGGFFHFFSIDTRNTIIDIKHFSNFLVILFFPLFVNELTPLRKLFPILWNVVVSLAYVFIVFVVFILFEPIKQSSFLFFVTNYAIYISAFILIMQLVFLVKAIRIKEKNALLLFIIYSVYITALIITNSLPNLGITTDDSPNVYANLLLSSVAEIVTFLFVIGKETLTVYKERTTLLEKNKNYQKQLLLATVESQEKERNRVGRELHDMVGANLAVIKQNISKEKKELRNIVYQTIETIRNLSHGLISTNIESDEFADEIRELCIMFSNAQLKIHCFFHNWERGNIPPETSTHLYRIVQELFQNAVKHSGATKIYIQFYFEESDNLIRIMYDDNGVGFDLNKSLKKGVGLLNIENRIKLINGDVQFDTNENRSGTSVMMEIVL